MNDREKEVFKIIVNHYLKNGESVGSRTLEKKYNMGVSSATIRNVMSDLEEMGFITKTHTSSGRIPTLEGYKKYIDEMLQISEIETDVKEQIFSLYSKRINKTDIIFKETVKMLSEISECVAIAIEPLTDIEEIKKIQFIGINSKDVFVVAVLKNNIVKTTVLTINTLVNDDNVELLNLYIKELLETTHKGFTLKDLERFLKSIGETDFEAFDDKMFEKHKIFIDGLDNLIDNSMNFEEIVDVIKMIKNEKEMKKIFKKLAKESEYDIDKAQIIFAKDLGYTLLEDYVFIFKCYEFGNDKGVIGLLSKLRIDYGKAIATIDLVIMMLKKMLNQNNENKYLEYKF